MIIIQIVFYGWNDGIGENGKYLLCCYVKFIILYKSFLWINFYVNYFSKKIPKR